MRAVIPAFAVVVLVAVAASAGAQPSAADLERAVIDAVNAARRERSLGVLQPDASLGEIARRHSCDMAERNYFENMLSPRFTTTGAGACRKGRAVYFTQLFLRPR
jgi:uncharacterized protein YkwD